MVKSSGKVFSVRRCPAQARRLAIQRFRRPEPVEESGVQTMLVVPDELLEGGLLVCCEQPDPRDCHGFVEYMSQSVVSAIPSNAGADLLQRISRREPVQKNPSEPQVISVTECSTR